MYKNDNINIFKITTIVLAVILVLVLGYMAYGKYTAYQNTKLQTAYNQGVSTVISQIYQMTENCGIAPLPALGNATRSIADVTCVQKAIQQGLSQNTGNATR